MTAADPGTGLHAGDYAESVRFYATQRTSISAYASATGQVDAFRRAGVEARFRSNGAPGYRDYAPGYYAAYLLDPDGNSVEALYRDVGNVGHGVETTLG